MSRDKELPPHVSDELNRRGIAMLGIHKSGCGHWCVEFVGPNGGVCKWSWPKGGGKSDPRAMLNNRSQLRHYLRRIYGDERPKEAARA